MPRINFDPRTCQEYFLLQDFNIMKEDALTEFKDKCVQKHGPPLPGYSLCQECTFNVIGLLAESFLLIKEKICSTYSNIEYRHDIEHRLYQIFEPNIWIKQDPRQIDIKPESLRIAVHDACCRETTGLSVSPSWIARRAKYYSRTVANHSNFKKRSFLTRRDRESDV